MRIFGDKEPYLVQVNVASNFKCHHMSQSCLL